MYPLGNVPPLPKRGSYTVSHPAAVETSPDIPTKIRTPPKKTREKFLLTHELKGAQEAVNLLTRYYGIRTMKIVLDGHRVGCGDEACYYQNKAYFTKRGLNKRNVLHELYHHLVYVNDLDTTKTKEEKAANSFARDFLS